MSVNVGTAVAYLTLDRSGFKNGIRSAGTDLKNFVTGTNGAEGRVKSLGNALTNTGKAMTKPSIAAGAFLGSAVKTAADFEGQMSKVQAISGATENDMKKLNTTAREWGAKTKFSAKEAGEAMEYMGMAGWKTQEMVDGLPGILNLAAASGEELGTTSDIVTDALTAFGLQAKDSAHFADILAAASTNSNTNVSMLGESFKYVAPVAGSLGISAKDTSFALGLMANSGIKGSAAGTALRSSLVNMAKPTKQMKKAMDQLGISLVDSNGKVKSGKVLFDELRQKFSKLSDAQKSQYAATIFGKEAMSGMLAIINASDKDYKKLYTSLSKCDGQAEKMANTMQNNLKGQLTNLKSAFEEMQISLAKAVVPMLTKLVKIITNIVNAFNKLPQPVKSAIGLLIGSIALLAPIFLILGKLVTSVGTVVGVFGKLGKAASIFKKLPSFASVGSKGTLKVLGLLKKGIGTVFTGIGKTVLSGVRIFAKLPALLSPHVLIAIAVIGGLIFIVYEVVKHWDKIKKLAGTIWNGIKKAVVNPVKKTFETLKIAGKKYYYFGKYMMDGLIKGIKSKMAKIKDTINDVGSTIKNKFKKKLGINSPSRVFAAYGNFIGEGLIQGIDNQENAINNKFKKLGNKIKGLGDVRPEFANLNNLALSGVYDGSYGLNNINNSNSKQLNFNPNINMNINIADAGEKGTEQLTQEVKAMSEVAIKNSMVDLFMKDAIRN
ncbi:phage tail tape measure protein [Clostridium botulinum]